MGNQVKTGVWCVHRKVEGNTLITVFYQNSKIYGKRILKRLNPVAVIIRQTGISLLKMNLLNRCKFWVMFRKYEKKSFTRSQFQ